MLLFDVLQHTHTPPLQPPPTANTREASKEIQNVPIAAEYSLAEENESIRWLLIMLLTYLLAP